MKSEDYFQDPRDVATADQVDAMYEGKLATAIAEMIKYMEKHGTISISVQANAIYKQVYPDGVLNDHAVETLVFMYAACAIRLAEVSMDLLKMQDENPNLFPNPDGELFGE